MNTSRDEQTDATVRCIAACSECNRICLQHIEHCLSLGGEHGEPAHISMLLACAAVCRTAGELMSLSSDWHPTMCDLCAQVCEECADECEELGNMDDCVAACQDCADACREIIGEQADDDEEDDETQQEDDAISSDERVN